MNTTLDTSDNIFTPGIYHGHNSPEYRAIIGEALDVEKIEALVRRRAMADGLFCTSNHLVGEGGENENKMYRMVLYVCDSDNIKRFALLAKEEGRSVDYLCRNLANSSRWSS